MYYTFRKIGGDEVCFLILFKVEWWASGRWICKSRQVIAFNVFDSRLFLCIFLVVVYNSGSDGLKKCAALQVLEMISITWQHSYRYFCASIHIFPSKNEYVFMLTMNIHAFLYEHRKKNIAGIYLIDCSCCWIKYFDDNKLITITTHSTTVRISRSMSIVHLCKPSPNGSNQSILHRNTRPTWVKRKQLNG